MTRPILRSSANHFFLLRFYPVLIALFTAFLSDLTHAVYEPFSLLYRDSSIDRLTRSPAFALEQRKRQKIRVLVTDFERKIALAGAELRFQFRNGEVLRLPGKQVLSVLCKDGTIEVKSDAKASKSDRWRGALPLKIWSERERLRSRTKSYEGRLVFDRMPVVSYGKPCLMVNHISMQKYLEGLLQVEMISSWPLAALQAQAVAARTYALSAIRETKRQRASNFPFDIGSTVEDQVFKGWRGDVPRIKKAVQTTRGKALFMAGRLNPTFYHSTCGGYTERPKDVWGESIRGYERRPCPYCLGSPVFEWSINVRSKKLEKLVKDSSRRLASNSGISQFFVSHRSEGGRVKEVGLRLNKHIETLQSEDFRKKVGRSFLKSSWFQVKGVQSRGERLLSVHLNGRGFGHGVGMCQWGARRLARMGKDFKEILKHYYPKGSLVRLY